MDWSYQTFLYSSSLCLEITAWWVIVVRSEQLPQPTHAVFNKTVISSTGRCTKQTKNKCALEISCGKLLDINQWLMLGLSQFWSSLKFHWFYYYQKSLSRLVPIAFDSLSLSHLLWFRFHTVKETKAVCGLCYSGHLHMSKVQEKEECRRASICGFEPCVCLCVTLPGHIVMTDGQRTLLNAGSPFLWWNSCHQKTFSQTIAIIRAHALLNGVGH